MKVTLYCQEDSDCYIPMDITGQPYLKKWEGEFNEAQLMWVVKNYPDCDMCPLKDYSQATPTVVGIEIALEGFYYGE